MLSVAQDWRALEEPVLFELTKTPNQDNYTLGDATIDYTIARLNGEPPHHNLLCAHSPAGAPLLSQVPLGHHTAGAGSPGSVTAVRLCRHTHAVEPKCPSNPCICTVPAPSSTLPPRRRASPGAPARH